MGSFFLRLWQFDWGLSVMSGTLLLSVFVAPPLVSAWPRCGILLDLFFVLVLLSGARVVLGHRALVGLVWAAVVLYPLVRVGVRLDGSPGWDIASSALSLAAILLLVLTVSLQIPSRGPITLHHIQGGVALYLLLGLAWAQAAVLLDLLDPTAFQLPATAVTQDQRSQAFLYFSFVTLTTLGYGDILPVSELARSLATSESLTGQLFPAILLARLVSMHVSARES